MLFIADLIDLAYNIFIIIVILQVAMSWLIAFDVVNAGNQQAENLIALLARVTDPLYKPLRKYVPPIGGIDITPLIVILIASFIRSALISLIL